MEFLVDKRQMFKGFKNIKFWCKSQKVDLNAKQNSYISQNNKKNFDLDLQIS